MSEGEKRDIDTFDTSNPVELFDQKASTWEKNYETPYFLDRLRMYDRWLGVRGAQLGDPGARRALDIGCGTFPAAGTFAAHGIQAVGVDVSQNMVRIARQLKRHAVRYNGVDLPFAANTFALITMFNTFEVVTQPAALWTEILRVSTPNACVLMTINNVNSPLMRVLRYLKGDPFLGKLKAWHSSYSVASVADIVTPLGFQAPTVYGYSSSSLLSHKAPRLFGLGIFHSPVVADNIYLEVVRHDE